MDTVGMDMVIFILFSQQQAIKNAKGGYQGYEHVIAGENGKHRNCKRKPHGDRQIQRLPKGPEGQ